MGATCNCPRCEGWGPDDDEPPKRRDVADDYDGSDDNDYDDEVCDG